MEDKQNTFIVCWCIDGLECVIPIDAELYQLSECERIANCLKDEYTPLYSDQVGRILSSLIIRSRMNSQRHYEIYFVNTSSFFSKEKLQELFEKDPQIIANSIRDKGQKVYSARLDPDAVQIR